MTFRLTPAEISSPLWMKLKKHIEERVSGHRRMNDGNLNVEDTAKLRGRIAESNYLLGLDSPAPQMDAGDS